jgi:competence protein ComGF
MSAAPPAAFKLIDPSALVSSSAIFLLVVHNSLKNVQKTGNFGQFCQKTRISFDTYS